MQEPIVSVAGVRGIVGKSLVPDDYIRRLLAFASMVRGSRVVVGGDTRLSRDMLRQLAFAGLTAAGYTVIDLGICPTPTVGFMVRYLNADCGLAITASHNPVEWNAFKFFNRKGTFITKAENEIVQKIYEDRSFRLADVWGLGEVQAMRNPLQPHLKAVLGNVDVRAIKQRGFRVAVDCCNGAGSEFIPMLLSKLGCEMRIINENMKKPFPHEPEPLPKNLTQLSRVMRRFKGDIGFALDPDADRLAIVDAHGSALGEERTLVIVANHFLKYYGKSPITVNLSVTRAIDDVADKFRVKVERTPVGEANVVERMLAIKGKIGGEGNGGIIIPEIHPGRDAATGIVMVLEAMAYSKASVTELNKCVPDYVMLKAKIERDPKAKVDVLLKKFERAFRSSAQQVIKQDGVKIILKDGNWLNARASGTEPIIRIFAEAPTKNQAQQLLKEARAAIEK